MISFGISTASLGDLFSDRLSQMSGIIEPFSDDQTRGKVGKRYFPMVSDLLDLNTSEFDDLIFKIHWLLG